LRLRDQTAGKCQAFECLLRGIDHHRTRGVTDENAREAVAWFSKAIEADPNYAAAYAWRVCAAGWLPDFDIDAGERDIRRALELDPCDPEANRILGVIELKKGNIDQAKMLSLRAMEMNPSDAYMRAGSAAVMTYAVEPCARFRWSMRQRHSIPSCRSGASRNAASLCMLLIAIKRLSKPSEG
jgi:tetratricopeptide (TPR) repeat protein